MICKALAPSTFLIPISFVRFVTVYSDKPNNPRLATIIDNTVNHQSIVENSLSLLYCLLKYSSRKKNCKGLCGNSLLHVSFALLIACERFFVLSFKEKSVI